MRAARAPIPIVLAATVLAGCAGPSPPPDVVLVSVDTLRADHLGAYGHARATSPRLDELARSSVVFTEAFSPAPRTFTSHVMMLTGVHPQRLGVTRDGNRSSIPAEAPFLPELLRAAGYQTVGFVDSAPRGWLSPRRGFDRGFDLYRLSPHRGETWHDAAATTDAALAWLAGRDRGRPYFLFFHTKSVHAVSSDLPRPDGHYFPYDKPEPYRTMFLPEGWQPFSWIDPAIGRGSTYLSGLNEAYFAGTRDPADFPPDLIDELKAVYDAGIFYTDEHLGRLFDALAAEGALDNTIVIVTADHGEAFLEHGFFKHSATVHREMLHVPLIVRLPDGEGARRRREPVTLGDIPPTILDLLGLPIPRQIEGAPLFAATFDPRAERPIYAYTEDGLTHATGLSVRRGNWKLIYDRLRAAEDLGVRLYDLSDDPLEQRPVEGEPERAAALLQELLAWRDGEPIAVGEEIELDEETLRQLRAVGYIK